MERVTNIDKKSEKKAGSPKLDNTALEILGRYGVEAFEKYIAEHPLPLPEEEPEVDEQPEPEAPSSPEPLIHDISDSGNSVADDISKVISRAPVEQDRQPLARPDTLRDTIKILQPKSVVFAQYSLSEWQENVLTLIMEQLQGYMSKSLSLLKPDIMGEVSIRINTADICGDDKKKALAQIEKLMDCKFEFWWQAKDTGTRVDTKGVIVSTYHNYVGTPYVDLVINKWALPFLLYYGPGIGANRYLKSTALSLPGKYSKRLYKILIGYVDKGTFDLKIDQFRKEFQIPDSYTTATIKRSIITPAIETINEHASGLRVSAKFIVAEKPKQSLAKKPTYDTIRFTIEGGVNNGTEEHVSEGAMLKAVYAYLLPLVDDRIAQKLGSYCKTMQMHGDLGLVYSKIRFYDQKFRIHEIDALKLKNTLFKVIRESAGIDLKPVRHRQVKNG